MAPAAAVAEVLATHHAGATESVRRQATEIVQSTVAAVADLDRLIAEHSRHWRVERLAVIDRLILRMAIWELRQPSAPSKAIVLNEAIELARRFSGEEAVKFVNGVLDAVSRALETEAPAASPDEPNHHVE
jgi:N utilization substance protein B